MQQPCSAAAPLPTRQLFDAALRPAQARVARQLVRCAEGVHLTKGVGGHERRARLQRDAHKALAPGEDELVMARPGVKALHPCNIIWTHSGLRMTTGSTMSSPRENGTMKAAHQEARLAAQPVRTEGELRQPRRLASVAPPTAMNTDLPRPRRRRQDSRLTSQTPCSSRYSRRYGALKLMFRVKTRRSMPGNLQRSAGGEAGRDGHTTQSAPAAKQKSGGRLAHRRRKPRDSVPKASQPPKAWIPWG